MNTTEFGNYLQTTTVCLSNQIDVIEAEMQNCATVDSVDQVKFELLDYIADIEMRIRRLEEWCLPQHNKPISQDKLEIFLNKEMN